MSSGSETSHLKFCIWCGDLACVMSPFVDMTGWTLSRSKTTYKNFTI